MHYSLPPSTKSSFGYSPQHFFSEVTLKILPVDQALAKADLRAPNLAALVPDVSSYTALLAQPEGVIEASDDGVRNRDRARADLVFGHFLDKAIESAADLAVTPEYSLPWNTLLTRLRAGARPAAGKLWALGCESLTLAELKAYQADLADIANIVFEDMVERPNRFLDPLVYVFLAESNAEAASKLVLLVQFKTHPMGDAYEVEHLHQGSAIYQFGGAGSLRLVSLICSDAFAFTDAEAVAIYQRSLILHIQLNPQPRQHQYRLYREKLFSYAGDETELICLNWAAGVCEWSNGKQKAWANPSGSAWYLRPGGFDARDAMICHNHKRGLYYTWLNSSRAHALFINYLPGIYFIEATKVAHTGVPASVSRRVGPKLQKVFVWDTATTALCGQAMASDGFAAILPQSGNARSELKRLYDASPIAAERALAVCAGKVGIGEWYKVNTLDSFRIETTEVIRRITFCQDTDADAADFRLGRLARCASLWQILSDENRRPPALADLGGGFSMDWRDSHPHQNIISAGGKRVTAIYLGEEVDDAIVKRVATQMSENLRRNSASDDESISSRQRLVVWFRREGHLHRFKTDRYIRFDDPRNTSDLDLTRQN